MANFLRKKFFILTASIFGLFFAANTSVLAADDSVTIDNPIPGSTLTSIIGGLIDFLLTIALIICPLMIVIGGFYFITAGGDPAKATKGRQIMIYAVIGLVIILISKGLVTAVKKAVGVI